MKIEGFEEFIIDKIVFSPEIVKITFFQVVRWIVDSRTG